MMLRLMSLLVICLCGIAYGSETYVTVFTLHDGRTIEALRFSYAKVKDLGEFKITQLDGSQITIAEADVIKRERKPRAISELPGQTQKGIREQQEAIAELKEKRAAEIKAAEGRIDAVGKTFIDARNKMEDAQRKLETSRQAERQLLAQQQDAQYRVMQAQQALEQNKRNLENARKSSANAGRQGNRNNDRHNEQRIRDLEGDRREAEARLKDAQQKLPQLEGQLKTLRAKIATEQKEYDKLRAAHEVAQREFYRTRKIITGE